MLRIHQSSSVAAAKSYYASGLESEGYYSKEGDAGQWFGKVAERLGLSGEVVKIDFDRLCENIRPDTGAKLNPRKDKDRKVGYDFTFSAPKSVSILFEVLGDRRILKVFEDSVRETMELVERNVEVRVRKKGVVATRRTGELVYARFVHHTTRPVILPGQSSSTVDPALHCHCYVMNTSFDREEGIFKAAELFPIKRDAPYFEAIFHSKLAWGLSRLGYGIQPKAMGFEVAGVGAGNIKCFSQRTAEIEQLAAQLGIALDAKAKSELGARTRKRKELRATKVEILRDWRRRIDRRELNYHQALPGNPQMTAELAVDLAISSAFERKSVVSYRRLVAEALRASLGAADLQKIASDCDSRAELISRELNGMQLATTKEILAEEDAIIEFLKSGRGTMLPIHPWHRADPELDDDQRGAVEALLRSTDRVFVIEGKAGTGKTSLMKSAVRAIEESGTTVFTFAPTSQASHEVLKGEGFHNSETIQQLLVNPRLQESIKPGSMLWIDEAGLLSTREMRSLFRIAGDRAARIVLSGDRFQHHSVERGDSLRLVVESGLVEAKQTRSIYRQRNDLHRQAVKMLSIGDVQSGFAILDDMGAIHQSESFAGHVAAVAEDYVQSRPRHGSVLVVAPTHFEGRLVTDAIRKSLLEFGEIAGEKIPVEIHRSRNLTVGERSQSRFMNVGDVVRFHQNAKGGFRRGETWIIEESCSQGIRVRSSDGMRSVLLPAAAAAHYQSFSVDCCDFAVGDRVRLLANLSPRDGGRLFNGAVHTITGGDRFGNLVLDHRHRIPKNSGLLDYGYVITSHASQGKTVGKVIVSQSTVSSGAASMEQFYVSVSRSRDAVSIWTDDKQGLLQSVHASDERMLGRDLGACPSRSRDEDDLVHEAELEEQQLQQTI
jgi:conjugative relaxase-like TrwC/TraI family protein